MKDRQAIGGRPLRRLAIELVVEDRPHRTVGQGADLDRPRGGGFEAIGAEWPHQPHDAKAGPEALLRVGPALQDQLAQRGGGWADRRRLAADALDRPVGIPPMARRHVLGHRGVPMVAAGPQMSGDPLALQKDLNRARSQSHLHLAARKTVGHAVEMTFELDVVIDTNPTDAPFGKAIGLSRQRFEVGPVELFEERAASDTEPADQAFVVELAQQLSDRRVEFGQTVEAAVAQAAEQPSLDDQHCDFDFRLVARPPRPCRQDRGIVMGRHLGIGSIDLRLVKTGFDDSDFGVVRHQQFGHAAERCKGSGMGADPVGQRLGPARLGIGEVGGAHDGDKNLRRTDLAGEPINDHRHRVAGVIDKQLVAADVSLPHRDRQPRRPTAVQLAEARIAITFGAAFDVLVP